MKLDEYGVLVSEIWPDDTGFAANRGDSMANTARWKRLSLIVNGLTLVWTGAFWTVDDRPLGGFISSKGYLRHPSPKMPEDWQEIDSPTDQCLPWYVAVADEGLREQMRDRIKANGWRTGNGDLVSPLFYAVLKNSQWGINLALLGQIAIFKLPIRWSDSKHNLELSANSSADVLNFFHCLPLASPWVRKLVNKDWIMQKIRDYFLDLKSPKESRRPEPNVRWLLALYEQAVVKVLG